MLIFMAIVLKSSDSAKVWPPVVSECPDYWYDSYYDINMNSGGDNSNSNGNGNDDSSCSINLSNQINQSSSFSSGDEVKIGTCYNIQELGDPSCSPEMDFSQDTWTGTDGDCNKYRWAKKCDITWDGITNQSNPCTSDSSNGDSS